MTFDGACVTTARNGPARPPQRAPQEDALPPGRQRRVGILSKSPTTRAIQACGLAIGLCLGGCSSEFVSDSGQTPAGAASSDESPDGTNAVHPAADEQWIALFLHDSKIGYGVTRFTHVDLGGQACIAASTELNMRIQRFGEVTEQTMRLTSTETLDGHLIRFESCLEGGGVQRISRGVQKNGQLRIQSMTAAPSEVGTPEELTLGWPPETRGFFALDQSLQQSPLAPGESRQLRAILPILNQIVEIDVEATGWEETDVLGDRRSLLRADVLTKLPDGNQLSQTMWLNSEGQMIKTFLPGLEQTTYQTTRADALNMSEAASFDLGTDSIVPLSEPLVAPHSASRIVYRVRLDREDPVRVFAEGGSQQIHGIDARTADLSVVAIRPDHPSQPPSGKPPAAGDLAANQLIESDDPRVVALARQVAAQSSDPWTIARALESHVHQRIEKKDFSQAFATAAQTAASRQGDCTEHAVLLAAVCRARNIPARVAIGLVYYPTAPGFAYHMWNEVWIADRWIPLDATLGLAGVGGGHLKINDSNLAGASAYSCFLPVVRVLGQLHLEVLEVD